MLKKYWRKPQLRYEENTTYTKWHYKLKSFKTIWMIAHSVKILQINNKQRQLRRNTSYLTGINYPTYLMNCITKVYLCMHFISKDAFSLVDSIKSIFDLFVDRAFILMIQFTFNRNFNQQGWIIWSVYIITTYRYFVLQLHYFLF